MKFSIAGEETETFRYSELAGRRITIGYEAETEEDAKALEAYGTVFHAPAYLVRMRPVLKLNGKEVACGEAEALGTDQDFTMTLTSAGKSVEICNFITVGSIYQVTLDGQTITAEELQKSYTEYQKIAETATMDNFYSDEYLGKILDVAGKLYFAQVDIANLFAAEA